MVAPCCSVVSSRRPIVASAWVAVASARWLESSRAHVRRNQSRGQEVRFYSSRGDREKLGQFWFRTSFSFRSGWNERTFLFASGLETGHSIPPGMGLETGQSARNERDLRGQLSHLHLNVMMSFTLQLQRFGRPWPMPVKRCCLSLHLFHKKVACSKLKHLQWRARNEWTCVFLQSWQH